MSPPPPFEVLRYVSKGVSIECFPSSPPPPHTHTHTHTHTRNTDLTGPITPLLSFNRLSRSRTQLQSSHSLYHHDLVSPRTLSHLSEYVKCSGTILTLNEARGSMSTVEPLLTASSLQRPHIFVPGERFALFFPNNGHLSTMVS